MTERQAVLLAALETARGAAKSLAADDRQSIRWALEYQKLADELEHLTWGTRQMIDLANESAT